MGGLDLFTVLRELSAIAPGVAVLALLAWLVIHVMRQNSVDRNDAQERITQLRKQHAEEIRDQRQSHDAEIADLRSQLDGLRTEVAGLRELLEAERQARWKAEDAAAMFRRKMGSEDLE